MHGSTARVLGSLLLVGLILAAAGTASAQAWLPPKGEAAFSLGWSRNWADHHIDYTGADLSPGDMIWHNAVTDLGYGVTDRLAVRVNIPFVTSKYVGTRPHPARPGRPPLDDGSWHSTFQLPIKGSGSEWLPSPSIPAGRSLAVCNRITTALITLMTMGFANTRCGTTIMHARPTPTLRATVAIEAGASSTHSSRNAAEP